MAKKLGPTARIIKLARKYLARGWRKGALESARDHNGVEQPHTCYCISGALAAAARDLDPNGPKPFNGSYADPELQEFIYTNGLSRYARGKLQSDEINHAGAKSPIVSWNDAYNRTQAQVVAALDRAFVAAKELGV